MELVLQIYIELFVLSILVFVLWNAGRRNGDTSAQHRLFIYLIIIGIVNVLAEMSTWLVNGRPSLMVLIWIVNIMDYMAAPSASLAWLVYILRIAGNRRSMKTLGSLAAGIYLPYAALVFTTPLTRLLFTLDERGLYHRGALYSLYYAVCYIFLATALAYILLKRKRLGANFTTMLLFPIPIVAGGILQTVFGGIPVAWSLYALLIVVIYVHIQNRHINTDYVTGAFSKQYIETLILKNIENRRGLAEAEGFSGYFIDLDDFKTINDRFGHREGDEALRTVKSLIDGCLGKNECVARYGGDEFLIVSERSTDGEAAELARKLTETIRSHNANTAKPYTLEFSIGFAVYDPRRDVGLEQFINTIDNLMLAKKNEKKGAGRKPDFQE